MTMKRLLALGAMAAVMTGCSGSGPRPVTVRGAVTHGGKPLAGATISFIPDPPTGGVGPGFDTTAPDGTYRVRTQRGSGLVPGKYRVLISKALADPSKVKGFEDDPAMARFLMDDPRAPKGITPAKIEAEFAREVPEGGGTFDFVIKSKTKDKAR